MINIPMEVKGPMHTSELKQINRVKRAQTVPALLQNRPAPTRQPPAAQSRPAPTRQPPAAQSHPSPTRQPPAAQSRPAPTRQPPAAQGRSAPPAPAPRPVQNRRHPAPSGMLLQKGQKVSLSQLDPGLDQLEVGLGWDLGPKAREYELDAEAFLLGPSGKVVGDDWFVFYNQPLSPDRAVRLLETDPPGSSPGDDALIQIHLRQLDPGVARILLILTISDAREKGYHFGNIANTYVRLVTQPARRELLRFQLTDLYSNVCSMMVGEIYRYKNEWRFSPIGNGTGDDLAGLCVRYGVNV